MERPHSTLTEIYRIIYNKVTNKDHDGILNEAVINYNNAIHSATKHTPNELFTGWTHKFLENVKYNNEHEFLQKLKEFREKIYATTKNKLQQAVEKNRQIKSK